MEVDKQISSNNNKYDHMGPKNSIIVYYFHVMLYDETYFVLIKEL